MYTRQKNHRIVFYVFSILVAVTIPLAEVSDVKYNSIAIIILAANWVLEGNYREKIERLRGNKIVLIFMSPFILNVLGLAYSTDISSGIKYIVLNLSVFLMPLIYGSSYPFDKDQTNRIGLAFTASVILCTFYLFKDGFVYTFGDLYNPHFIAILKREIIGRTYASIYLTFILFILYIRFFAVEKKYAYRNILIILITAYVVYLNGILIVKTTILASFLIAFTLIAIYLVKAKKWTYFISLISACFLISVIFYYSTPKISDNVSKIIHAQPIEIRGSGVNFEMNSFSTRSTIWGAAIEVLRENNNWLIGVGTGDEKSALKEKYIQKKLPDILYLDVHNEYLQTWLRNGIAGLIILLCCLILPFIAAFKTNNYLYMSFLLLCFLCFFTESWFGRQTGIVFYSFFNAILFFGNTRPLFQGEVFQK